MLRRLSVREDGGSMLRIKRAQIKARDMLSWTYVRSTQFFHNNLKAVMFLFVAVILAT